jgi:hypothetical protein
MDIVRIAGREIEGCLVVLMFMNSKEKRVFDELM